MASRRAASASASTFADIVVVALATTRDESDDRGADRGLLFSARLARRGEVSGDVVAPMAVETEVCEPADVCVDGDSVTGAEGDVAVRVAVERVWAPPVPSVTP